ncbi:CAP domain-containing protein, partial [Crepidotus variabilis]
MGQTGLTSVQDFVNSWTSQEKNYIPSSDTFPANSDEVGCFTQVVWKATTKLGCDCTPCSSGFTLGICVYEEPGNFGGQFSDNVQAQVAGSSMIT